MYYYIRACGFVNNALRDGSYLPTKKRKYDFDVVDDKLVRIIGSEMIGVFEHIESIPQRISLNNEKDFFKGQNGGGCHYGGGTGI